jgi:hypothetical protein
MTASRSKADDHWSGLTRSELIAVGRTIVTERLEHLGSTVEAATGRSRSKLQVRTRSGRSLEVFVSTQRLGGYVFWTKQRFQPAADLFAAIALLADAPQPELYLLPSTEWLSASPPLTDRDNIGKRSDPEYGVSLARSSLPALERYRWNGDSGDRHFR